MKQGYREQRPTDDQHSVSHLPSAARGNEIDDKRKAEKPGDDQRSGNDMAPCVSLARIGHYAKIRSQHLVVIFYQSLLYAPIGGKSNPCRG